MAQRFGILAGPSEADQNHYIETLKYIFRQQTNIDTESLKFVSYPEANLVSIEATSYRDQKSIADLSGKPGIQDMFSLTHLDDLPKYLDAFKNFVPKVTKGEKSNLSSLYKRFSNMKFNCNFPQAMSSLLLYTGVYAKTHNLSIKVINLASNRIKNLNGMRLIKSYFPDLKTIYIGGNSITNEQQPSYLNDIELINEVPVIEDEKDSDDSSSDDDSDEEKVVEKFVPPPDPIIYELTQQNVLLSSLSYDSFTHNEQYVKSSELKPFLIPYLRCLEEAPQCASNYYTDTATLSLLILKPKKKPNTPLNLYNNISTDITKGQTHYWRGSEIADGLNEIFPYGFHHKISYLITHQFDDFLYSIVFHGVCIGKEAFTYYFDRTLTIRKERNVFFVSNDCITLRDEKKYL